MDYTLELQMTVIALYTLFIGTCAIGTGGMKEEVRLLRDLLAEYDPAARPVKNLTDIVEVKMGVALFQIRELHEKNQYLQINAWFQFHWTDPNLTWNVTDYGGIPTIRIPSQRVWVPDIVLYNSVDETKSQMEVFPETNAIVSHTGKILWVIPAMTKSSCKIDIKYFPFDEQSCPLKFGSWTYDGFQLNLVNLSDSGDLSKYIESGEWTLIGMPLKQNVVYYTCCIEPYPDITYNVVIRRKPMFFTYNLVFPCMLLMGIGVMVFCLPPESGEKVSLGVTVLLAMTVYQLLIAEAIPPTSEVIPLIGQFFGSTIFLLSLSTAMTVVIMKLHFSGEHGHQVPSWLRKVVLVGLARVVRMGNTTKSCKQRVCMDYPEASTLLNQHQSSHNNHQHSGSHHGRRGGSGGMDGISSGRSSSSMANHQCGVGGHNDSSNSCNMILLNNIMHNNGSTRSPIHNPKFSQRVTSSSDNYGHQPNQYYSQNDNTEKGLLTELVFHVKQINEELHSRNANKGAEEFYKSEWRMVALVLDRILLIFFFIITVFTCVVIFINVPHGHGSATRGFGA